MAEDKKIATGHIGNALRSTAADHTTTFADEIFDTERQQYQSEVNTDIEQAIIEEAQARAKADEQLNTAIAVEKERAEVAEGDLSAEITRAKEVDDEIQNKLADLCNTLSWDDAVENIPLGSLGMQLVSEQEYPDY